MANFIGLVYASLKNEGIDTKGMDTDEAIKKYNELQEKTGGKPGEHEGTPAEQRKLKEKFGEDVKQRDDKYTTGNPDNIIKASSINNIDDDLKGYKGYGKVDLVFSGGKYGQIIPQKDGTYLVRTNKGNEYVNSVIDAKNKLKQLQNIDINKNNNIEYDTTKVNTNFRKQLDYKGKANAISQIMNDIGVNKQIAEETYSAIDDYTGNLYNKIRDENFNAEWAVKDRKLIEDLIKKSPKYDGEIFRGIALDNESGKQYINSLSKNSTIDMGGISSWSVDKKTAQKFASKQNKPIKILFNVNNKSGIGIKHLATFDQEGEVLASKNQKYKVNKINKVGNYYQIQLEEN